MTLAYVVALGTSYITEARSGRARSSPSFGTCPDPTEGSALIFSGSLDIGARGRLLLRLDVGCLDYLAPLLGFIGNELAEIGRRARNGRAAKIGQSCLQFGVGDAGVDLPVELVDDIDRCVPGRADALPAARLVPRHKFAQGRNVWQNLRTRWGCDCERAQPAGPNMFNRFGDRAEVNLHLTAEQIGHRGCPIAIRHMQHLNTGHRLE